MQTRPAASATGAANFDRGTIIPSVRMSGQCRVPDPAFCSTRGCIPSRNLPLLILCASLLLAAFICLPVAADDNATIQHTVAIRQAHLAWTALDRDVEMNAAIPYCKTLYGTDTTGLNHLLSEFQAEEARIPSAATRADLSSLIAEMRNTTAQFRTELDTIMATKQGNRADLSREIAASKLNNPYIQAKKDTYWTVRKTNQLADFDTWVREGQQILNARKIQGYDITAAQRALDVFSAKRPDVAAALGSRSDTAIETVNLVTVPLSESFIDQLLALDAQVPDSGRWNHFIQQGDRVVAEADRINIALIPIIIDIGDADPVLSKTKTDLNTARNVLNTGNLEATKVPLRLVQKDFTDLALAYRDIRNRVALPGNLSEELNTMALRLDETAGEMGAAL